jgi:IS605 OrfB family transposase
MAMPDQKPAPVTQRAYTLRLRGAAPEDQSWRENLWRTHEAVNKGAEAFGDWLLTLRGSLDHTLADAPVPQGKNKPDRQPTADERRDRRILLALSWLSVESKHGAPSAASGLIVASGGEPQAGRNRKVLAALKDILKSRRLADGDIDAWVKDCEASLSAAIRDDAVWVNRSKAFDMAAKRVGTSLTCGEVWDMLERFVGSPHVYLSPLGGAEDEGAGDGAATETRGEEKAKDLVQKAGQWLSSRFGTGKGADFSAMGRAYEAIGNWAGKASPGMRGAHAVAALAAALSKFNPASNDLQGVLGLVSGPGYKSATRNILSKVSAKQRITRADLDGLKESAEQDAQKCKSNTGAKGRRPYSDAILSGAEGACGFTYLQKNGPARHSEFAVMLDHAARRVSLVHTWIKRAEAERRQFEEDAKKMANVPAQVRAWLDKFCEDRSGASGAVDGYRIRRRAVDGWKEVVAAWAKAACKTENERIIAARALQDDPEIDKFGDIQLFEGLASDEAECVWRLNGKADPQPLLDYVAATDAEAKKRRFKVPAYRHPDPLLHPVFCDFGYSRWKVAFAVHEARRRLIDAEGNVAEAKTLQQKQRAQQKLDKVKQEFQTASGAEGDRIISMGLWTGKGIEDAALRWQSKRLVRDLALHARHQEHGETPKGVSRADRLGRAAADAAQGSAVSIIGLFGQKEWNGRLQAPRPQLEAIARIRDNPKLSATERRNRMAKMMSHLRWLITFSAKLQPQGPWTEFASRNGLKADPKYWPHADENKRRQGLARLVLGRLPCLRVLSVDLGHRYAAACAVWETLSADAFAQECKEARKKGAAIESGPNGAKPDEALYAIIKWPKCKTKKPTKKAITEKRDEFEPHTVYRRVGPDVFTSTGEVNPAPWARLDRQFLVKLQGEDRLARWPTESERTMVADFEKAVGREAPQRRSFQVDELMSAAVQNVRLAIQRHGRRARVAFNLTATKRLLPGSRQEDLTPEGRVGLLADTLADWYALFTGKGWCDEWAKKQWDAHIAPLLGGAALPQVPEDADATPKARKKYRADLTENLKPVADSLAKNDSLCQKLHCLWATRWREDDAAWRKRLRWLRDWILPRGKRGKDHVAICHVGGLSLTRIATIKSLYQVQKAFHMRPEPDDLRKNIPAKGDDALLDFGRSILDAMEHMREQRVKQLASRIAEAALGIGRMKRPEKGKDPKRPRTRVDQSCHAVVIENLTHYRPEETRTRRENRQLMSWSSSKVKKYLSEACQLHGLHLREVQAGYTSRQDSRTGAPGVRCQDVPVADYVRQGGYLWKRVKKALDEVAEKNDEASAENRLLASLYRRWDDKSNVWTDAKGAKWTLGQDGRWSHRNGVALDPKKAVSPAAVRIPQRGGEVFVSADPHSPAAKGLQADLNAAANIGLRALIDPDWPARWWYVPCNSQDFKPHKDKVKGCLVVDSDTPLKAATAEDDPGTGAPRSKKKAKAPSREIVYLWRDVSTRRPVTAKDGPWEATPEYWNKVQARVIGNLRKNWPSFADKEESASHGNTPR